MNPYECRVELRIRSVFEVLDLAFVLLRVWAGAMVRLGLVLLVPAALAAVFVERVTGQGEVAVGVLILLSPALQLPYTILGSRMLFADPPQTRAILRAAMGRAGRVGIVLGVQAAVLALSACSALVLFLPLQIATLFLGETLILEGVTLSRAFRRASLLASEYLGKAVVGAFVLWLLLAWAVVAGESVGQAMVAGILQLGTPFGAMIEGAVTPYVLVAVVAVQPVVALFRLLLYVDVRTALDGWDLQVELKAAGEEA